MPTIRAGDRQSLGLDPGKVLTVTADSISSAIVRTFASNTQGLQSNGQVAVPAGGAQSFGPYLVGQRFVVEGVTGSVNYTQGDAVPGTSIEKPIYQDQTGAMVKAGGAAVSGPGKRQVALHRPWGLRSGVAATSTLQQSRLHKLVFDAPFNQIRLHRLHYGTTQPTWKFAIAATETADTSTNANLSQPIVGGSAYNVIDSTTDAYGWRTSTVAGASTKAFSGTGSVSGSDSVAEIVSDDWIACQSVPRADGGYGYLLMVQAYSTDTTTGKEYSWINASGIAAMRTPTSANRGRILQWSRGAGDNIASPGGSTFTLVEDGLPFMVEARYRTQAETVMQFGDSLFQNDGMVADKVSCALARACADISTSTRPVVCANTAGSSMATAGFWREAQKIAAIHAPSVAIYECFSPNDNPYTNAGVMRYKLQVQEGRIAEFLAFCKANSIKPILDTGVPYMAGLDATTDALRKAHVAAVKNIAAAAGAGLIDSDAFFSDGGSPANIKAVYNFGDNIHFNEAGVEAKATQLIAPALNSALGII